MAGHVGGERITGEREFVHRRHCSHPEREAGPSWALVSDLRDEVGVKVTNSNPAQSCVGWAKIVERAPHAEQGQIVENGIGCKDADVATDFDGAPPWSADCA